MDVKGSTKTNPYITFNGNCKEAMCFYKKATGGDLFVMPFEGSPVEVPEGYEQKVLHSTLVFGGATIMASDSLPGQEVDPGNNCHIMLGCDDLEDAEVLFNNLSHDGAIVWPFSESVWGARFGLFTDKFGISWMVHCDCKPEDSC